MEAALAADDKMGGKAGHEVIVPVPVMFLVGQSIELALKAYLVAKGVPLRDLRTEYGHELHKSLRKAKELGLLTVVPLDTADTDAIELLDAIYSTKELQYIQTGFRTYPVFGPLERAALKLIHGIGAHVGYPPRNLPGLL